jgi:signal transduction histidine kinase
VSHDDERVVPGSSRPPRTPDRRTGLRWLAARSAGEILALAAPVLSALALIVVLDDGDAPSALRDQAVGLLGWLEAHANAAAALAVLAGLLLAWALALAIRSRDDAIVRADRLARALATSRDQVERLRSTLEARDTLLLAVVHELRTPLTHVVGYAELLSDGARPRHPEEVGEMSAAIQGASTTMLRLMDDLVEATRAQSEGFSLKARPVDLVHLIRGVVAGYEAQEQTHRVTLDLPDHWLAVRADPERIHQILANLLTNAISYSPNGGEVRVSARQAGDRVRVEIADHGIGMDAEDQRRAFDRFYRARGGREVREHGSGLGLAIVRDLVEAHGGEVGLSSEPGVGSTFWFTLPAADDRPVVASEPRLTVHKPTTPAPRSARAS